MKNVVAGENIRKSRNEKCYSQEYVANLLGVTQSTYQRIEAGTISLTLDRLEKLAEIYNQPLDSFLTNKPSAKEKKMVSIDEGELWQLHDILTKQTKYIEQLESTMAALLKLTK